MMQEELFDILDATGEKTGEVRTREDAHRLGLLHRTVHVWVINDKKEVLLQKRSRHIRSHPGLWDISAAGHIAAGEGSLETAQREAQEELGLSLPLEAFQLLKTIRQQGKQEANAYIDDEFQDIYIVRIGDDVSVQHDGEEVEDTKWLDAAFFEAWTRGEGEPMVNHKDEYALIASYLRSL